MDAYLYRVDLSGLSAVDCRAGCESLSAFCLIILGEACRHYEEHHLILLM